MSAHSMDTVAQPALTDSFRAQQASLCSVLPRPPSFSWFPLYTNTNYCTQATGIASQNKTY